SIEHLFALIDGAAAVGVKVVVHAILDGRDTPPSSGDGFVGALTDKLQGKGSIGMISGRDWAMDRDKRWDRVERAWKALGLADGPKVKGAREAIRAAYAAGKTDEFVEPVVLEDYAGIDRGKDTALFFNFRPDRAREISQALTDPQFKEFPRPAGTEKPYAYYV